MSDMLATLRTSAHDLRCVPDGSVHAVITSPPYYGLRSYAGEQDVEWPTVTYRLNEWCEPVTVQGCEPGCEHEWVDGPVKTQQPQRDHDANGSFGQSRGTEGARQGMSFQSTQDRYCLRCGGWRGPLGLEPSPVAYIGHLILCLREWRRVLRDDGVCFVNLGDSYTASGTGAALDSWNGNLGQNKMELPQNEHRQRRANTRATGLKPKDLLGIPWMFAFAARADGWYLRSDIIWHKPNPMPESVTDRPTKAHEYIFVLTKRERYYWDADAVREANSTEGDRREGNGRFAYNGKFNGSQDDGTQQAFVTINPAGRNIRTVWTIATAPYPGAHYAVFPERLVEPMVKAATSERGCCPNCGAPWRRVVERSNGTRTIGDPRQFKSHPVPGDDREYGGNRRAGDPQSTTLGWQPTCACYEPGIVESTDIVSEWGDPIPCTVLDPFAGSGTTGRVAVRLGRRAILCDVSDEYLDNHVPERTTVQMELVA